MNGGLFARVIVGVALAFVAGVANFLWLNGQKKTSVDEVSATFIPAEFLRYTKDVGVGDAIECAPIVLGVPKDNADVAKAICDNFFLANDQTAVDGQIATRRRKANELVMRADLYASTSPNAPPPKSCLLGPFRVRNIEGSRMTIDVDYRQEPGNNPSVGYFDSKVDRLLQIVARRTNDPDLSILAVVSYPNEALAETGNSNETKKIAINVQIPSNVDLSEIQRKLKKDNVVFDDDSDSKTSAAKSGSETEAAEFAYVGFVVPAAALTDNEIKDSFPVKLAK